MGRGRGVRRMEKAKYLIAKDPDIDFDTIDKIARRNIMNCQRYSSGCGDAAWHIYLVGEDAPNRSHYAKANPIIEIEDSDDGGFLVVVFRAHLLRNEDYEALIRAGFKPATPKRLGDVIFPCEGCSRADTIVYVADLGDGQVAVFYEDEYTIVAPDTTTFEVCDVLGLCFDP